MFEFFEGLIEKLGVKLIADFSSKLYDFIKETKNNSKGDLNDNGNRKAQIGSSGDSAKIGSSGYSAKIGSSGYPAKIGSSGDYAQIGSSGDSAKIGSSGYSAKIGSSGDSAQIGSSGDSAQIGSSGDSAQIGSSGDYAKIGSSGYSAQIGSSGDYAKIGSSGDSAQIDISGKHTVGFACGYKSKIKAKKGTWVSLCEYGRDKYNNYIPTFALSAQIGNKEYKDFRGRILKETEYYCLYNKKFYPVDISDGIDTIKISEKKKDNITIIKGLDLYNTDREYHIVKEKKLSAHGKDLKKVMEDLLYKKTKSEEVQAIINEIKKTKKVNKEQYRAITGACQFGTDSFCEKHNITTDEIELSKLRKILINDYGAEKFWGLLKKKSKK